MKSNLIGKIVLLALITFVVWSISSSLIEKNRLTSHENFIIKSSIEASETTRIDIITPHEEIKGLVVSYWSAKEGIVEIHLTNGDAIIVGGDFIVKVSR